MKHPALARVFALVLAVMAVVLSASGVYNVFSAIKNRREEIRIFTVLSLRTEEYEQLTGEIAASDSLDELNARLSRLQVKHDRTRAEHQINLGTYTAARSQLRNTNQMVASFIPNLSPDDVTDEMLDLFSAVVPLVVALYPEVQDAVNNMQPEAGMAVEDKIKSALYGFNAESIVNDLSDIIVDVIDSETEYEFDKVDYEICPELRDYFNELKKPLVDSIAQTGRKAVENTVAGIVKAVDSLDEGVYQLKQISPYLNMIVAAKKDLDKTKTDLINSRMELDRQETELKELQKQVDDLTEKIKRATSLSVLLKTNPNIRSASERNSDLLSVASAERDRYERAYRRSFAERIAVASLMIGAAVAAFLAIPAAYERSKSRTMLVLPVVLFSIFSLAAELLNEFSEGERQYAAIVAAALGIIQLFIIFPKEEEL